MYITLKTDSKLLLILLLSQKRREKYCDADMKAFHGSNDETPNSTNNVVDKEMGLLPFSFISQHSQQCYSNAAMMKQGTDYVTQHLQHSQ